MLKRKKHILVADDDPIYRDIAKDALEKAGHHITEAEDGGKAIALLMDHAFDAAIIDLNMPVAGGLDVIAALRKGTTNATIPVIVITGHDDSSAVEAAYRVGATSFLTKPLNWLLFTPHVEFVLRSGATEKELREANATTAFLSDLKSQMMTALAQEFQSPIKTIFGFSQLINKEVYGPLEPPAYKDMMADISKSADGLNAALLKLMDFGRTLTEHLQIETVPVNARDALSSALSALEAQADRRDVRIVPDVSLAADCFVHADPALLNQALRGVFDNAIRLSPRGASIRVNAAIAPDGDLTVAVSDDGPLIPNDLLVEMNGHAAGKSAVNRPQPSNDVSIKIAKILTEAHHGRMTVESSSLSGNTVRMTIPRVQKSDFVTAPALPAEGASQQRLQRIGQELSQDPRLKSRLAGNLRSPAFAGARDPATEGTR